MLMLYIVPPVFIVQIPAPAVPEAAAVRVVTVAIHKISKHFFTLMPKAYKHIV